MPRPERRGKPTPQKRPPESTTPQPLICARWMTTRLHTVKPLDSVAHARALMEEHRINHLPVVRNGVLVGIITDRDLRDAVESVITSAKLAHAAEPVPGTSEKIPVETVMTHNVITLAPHSTMVNAAAVMRRERLGCVPIVDGGFLVGIVTRNDVLDAFIAREDATQTAPTAR